MDAHRHTRTVKPMTRTRTITAALTIALIALTGCSSDSSDNTTDTTPATTADITPDGGTVDSAPDGSTPDGSTPEPADTIANDTSETGTELQELGQRISEELGINLDGFELRNAQTTTVAELGHPCAELQPTAPGTGISLNWGNADDEIFYTSVNFETEEAATEFYNTFNDTTNACLAPEGSGSTSTTVDLGTNDNGRQLRQYTVINGEETVNITISTSGTNFNLVIGPDIATIDALTNANAAALEL